MRLVADDYSDFTTEQLLALANGLGLPDPLFLRTPPVSEWPHEVRREVETLGVRSLMARDLVRIERDKLRIPLVLRHLMAPLCESSVVTTVVRSGAAGNTVAQMYSHKGHTTAHQPSIGGNHRLRVFPTAVIGTVIVRLCELRKVDAPSGHEVTITADQAHAALRTLVTAIESGELGDPPAPALENVDLGALEAIGTDININNVTVTRLASESTVSGAVVSWIDGGPDKLFLVEQADDTATITPASGDDVLAAVMTGYTDGTVPDLTNVAWDETLEPVATP
ncbi:MAG: hypothetical protein DHS20C19_12210 [Acidimicrobiales bacterium]|nr:MAG: hypothetical protein DHS20C19_12210 [Acidimicrobiales bacterium]